MPKEIERKFLVKDTAFLRGPHGEPVAKGERIIQGYLSMAKLTLRVRRLDDRCYLTLKGPSNGLTRDEFEYEIPREDADQMLELYCDPGRIEKTRYRLAHGPHEFEVDVFEGHLRGLVIAEVELDHEEQSVELPPWIGCEVSHDPRYYNANLARAKEPPPR
jgi:CYTH domain-containing protein